MSMLPSPAVMQNPPDEHQQSSAMRTPGQGASPGQMANRDRARNRLGYHRTSVACVNCRHRKIRCQVTNGEERCVQCIRLRKLCKFQSVDQQMGQERAASLSEDTSPAEMAPLVLTASPEAVAPEVPSNSYVDYNHHNHPHGGMLPNGVGGNSVLHEHAPSHPMLLSERAPDVAVAAAGTPTWLTVTPYLGAAMPTTGLSPYTAHDALQQQHAHPHQMHSLHLHAQHAVHSPSHGHQHVFHPVLGNSNGVGTEAPWAHATAAQATEGHQHWTYPPP